MVWVMLLGLLLILGAVVAGAQWLRRSGLLPRWLTSNELKDFPAQLLFFLAFLFVPFIVVPWLILYVVRERGRRSSSHADAVAG